MSRVKRAEQMVNFWSGLSTHVRPGSGGGLEDTREQFLLPLLRKPPSVVIEFMAEVPEDIAAMCCGVVGVENPIGARAISTLQRRELADALQRMRVDGGLPLVAAPDHPVAGLLNALLESDDGRMLYRNLARILCAATDDTDQETAGLREVLYIPPSQRNEGDGHGGSDVRESS